MNFYFNREQRRKLYKKLSRYNRGTWSEFNKQFIKKKPYKKEDEN